MIIFSIHPRTRNGYTLKFPLLLQAAADIVDDGSERNFRPRWPLSKGHYVNISEQIWSPSQVDFQTVFDFYPIYWTVLHRCASGFGEHERIKPNRRPQNPCMNLLRTCSMEIRNETFMLLHLYCFTWYPSYLIPHPMTEASSVAYLIGHPQTSLVSNVAYYNIKTNKTHNAVLRKLTILGVCAKRTHPIWTSKPFLEHQ